MFEQSTPKILKTVLVTGASGFIGKRFCSILRSKNVRILALSRSGAHPEGTESIVVDLAEDTILELPGGIDTVFHLAGKAHALSEVAQDDAEYSRINRDGTRRLLEAAQRGGVRAFVFFSSIKAVGDQPRSKDAESRPIDEANQTPPDTPYGRSKREAEVLVLKGNYVPHPVVLRPTLVYGPGVLGNLEKMSEAVSRKRFPPLPEFNNKRSMVSVDDLIEAALLAAEKPGAAGQTYVVTDNVPCSTRDLFVWMSEAFGQKVPSWTIPVWFLRLLARIGDGIGHLRGRRFVFDSTGLDRLTGDSWYSSAKIQKDLGWVPKHTIRESLPEIVHSAKKGGGPKITAC